MLEAPRQMLLAVMLVRETAEQQEPLAPKVPTARKRQEVLAQRVPEESREEQAVLVRHHEVRSRRLGQRPAEAQPVRQLELADR